jgi:hypothetical protein
MGFPLREIDILGVFMAPAAVMLVICAAVFFVVRRTLNQLIDLNRYVWRRSLFDVACFVLFYCIAILTMRMR